MLGVLDCTTVEGCAEAYVRELLPREQARAIDEHLKECDACQFRVDQFIVAVSFSFKPTAAVAAPLPAPPPSTPPVAAAVPAPMKVNTPAPVAAFSAKPTAALTPSALVQEEINETRLVEACAADGGRRDACTTIEPAVTTENQASGQEIRSLDAGGTAAGLPCAGMPQARRMRFRSIERLSGLLLSLRDPARRWRSGPGHPAWAERDAEGGAARAEAGTADGGRRDACTTMDRGTANDPVACAERHASGAETRLLEAGATTAGGTMAARLLSLPWWAVSAALHVLVIALIGLISMSVGRPDDDDAVVVVAPLFQRPAVQPERERKAADLTALEAKNFAPPTDPMSKLQCDVTVPPDVLAAAQLSDHFETVNPEGPDLHSAFGNPDAHMFQALRGDDAEAGGGGTGGESFDALLGAGGAATKGSGGGFGGGTGTGIGTDFGSGSGCFGQRTGRGRELLVKRHGGSPQTEAAVDRALYWLARHQAADGHWDIAKFEGGNTASGGYATDECVAPLAVLAFLGAGHSPKAGKYKDTVKRGLAWILGRQQPNGSIKMAGMDNNPMFARMMAGRWSYCYSEALATLALAEAYGMTNDKQLGDAAQRGINFLTSIQEADGGWSHSGCKSTSVVGWVVMAMKSAKIANLRVQPEVFTNAIKYLDLVTEKDRNGYYGLAGYGGPKQYCYNAGYTMTAVAMVCYQFMGRIHDTERQAELLAKNLPVWTPKTDFSGLPQNFYHWYYGTLGLFQTGGEAWDKWNAALQKTLLPHQHVDKGSESPDGSIHDLDGSWDPATTWDPSGGRVYSTAMGALCLEVYYRYLQVQKH